MEEDHSDELVNINIEVIPGEDQMTFQEVTINTSEKIEEDTIMDSTSTGYTFSENLGAHVDIGIQQSQCNIVTYIVHTQLPVSNPSGNFHHPPGYDNHTIPTTLSAPINNGQIFLVPEGPQLPLNTGLVFSNGNPSVTFWPPVIYVNQPPLPPCIFHNYVEMPTSIGYCSVHECFHPLPVDIFNVYYTMMGATFNQPSVQPSPGLGAYNNVRPRPIIGRSNLVSTQSSDKQCTIFKTHSSDCIVHAKVAKSVACNHTDSKVSQKEQTTTVNTGIKRKRSE